MTVCRAIAALPGEADPVRPLQAVHVLVTPPLPAQTKPVQARAARLVVQEGPQLEPGLEAGADDIAAPLKQQVEVPPPPRPALPARAHRGPPARPRPGPRLTPCPPGRSAGWLPPGGGGVRREWDTAGARGGAGLQQEESR